MAHYECRGTKRTWTVRFRIVENGVETHKRLSGFARKKDAEEAYRNYLFENDKKTLFPNRNIMDKKFVEVYSEFMSYKKSKVKESTFYDLTKVSEKHILPFFSDFKIKNITKNVILSFQNTLNNYSYKYKMKIRGFLHSLYRYLFLYYDLDNVVARVESFVKPVAKQEMKIWSIKDFNAFIESFQDDILYKTFFTFLYYTGCRLGEVLALNYKDFNFDEKKVDICKNISTRSFNKAYYVTTPKNQSSIRKILLPQRLIRQLEDYITISPDSKSKPYFFGGDRPLDDHTIYRRLEKHCLESGVEKIRIHDFRHSHASFLIENGASIVLVAKRLGHTSTEQTLNTYAHLFPNSESELIDKLENS